MSCGPSGIIGMQIFAVRPLFGEAIILVPDHHLGSMSILLCEFDGRGQSLLFAGEGRGDVAAGGSDLPVAIVV